MKLNLVILLAFIAMVKCQTTPAPTPSRFIVTLAEVTGDTTRYRCVGTPFTRRHILTTAACVNVPNVVVQVVDLSIDGGPNGTMRSCKFGKENQKKKS
jgi:hypothetical protein